METIESKTLEHLVSSPVGRRNKRAATRTAFVVGLVIINLMVGLVGGVAGFVLLANNTSPRISRLRTALGIGANAKVAIPVTQTIKLEESSAVINAVKKVAPAVVSITTSQDVSDYLGQVSNQEIGGGSGFIITSDGLIVTNKHVVAAGTSYKVALNDGRIFDAKIQASDPLNDLAVVKIEAQNLPTVEFGNSENLQIGQYVIAIGNALGEFNNSVTLGVVSAKNRSLNAGSESGSGTTEHLTGLIQTDASINPGNSGGPLVNLAGQVIGIDTAIASTSGGSVGIGFAMPISSVQLAIDSVRKTGQIIRPFLGVRYIPVDKTVQQLDKLSVDYGALVARGQTAAEVAVQPGSPADKAGLQENDIILEVNGERVNGDNPLPNLLEKYQVGDTVTIKIQRKGAEQTVKATLQKTL